MRTLKELLVRRYDLGYVATLRMFGVSREKVIDDAYRVAKNSGFTTSRSWVARCLSKVLKQVYD